MSSGLRSSGRLTWRPRVCWAPERRDDAYFLISVYHCAGNPIQKNEGWRKTRAPTPTDPAFSIIEMPQDEKMSSRKWSVLSLAADIITGITHHKLSNHQTFAKGLYGSVMLDRYFKCIDISWISFEVRKISSSYFKTAVTCIDNVELLRSPAFWCETRVYDVYVVCVWDLGY